MKSRRVPAKLSRVPRQYRKGFSPRTVGYDDDQWEVGKEMAEDVMGTTRNKVANQLWAWWLRMPGAELPERPPADVVERAFEAYRERKAAKAAEDAAGPDDDSQS